MEIVIYIIIAVFIVGIIISIISKPKSEEIIYENRRPTSNYNPTGTSNTDTYDSIGKFETKIIGTSYKDLPVYQFLMRGVIPIKRTAKNI